MAIEMDEEQILARAEAVQANAGMNKSIAKLEATLTANRDNLNEYLRTIASLYQQEEELAAELAEAMKNEGDRTPEFAKQLSTILKLKEVAALEVSRHGVEVFTHSLITPTFRDGHRRDFGMFQITLGFNGEVHVRCMNPEDVKDPEKRRDKYYSYEHPHVYGEQQYAYPRANVCWGNMGDAVTEYLGARQFDAVSALIVQFLSTFNEGGAYSANAWKVYDEDAKRKPKPKAKVLQGGVEELVHDQEGAVIGVRVTPGGQEAKFGWERTKCNGTDGTRKDGRYGECGVCGKTVLFAANGKLRAHGTRNRVQV